MSPDPYLDLVARKLGYKDMAELLAEEKEQKRLAEQAQRAEEERIQKEARQAEIAAEDAEINGALASGRMLVELRRIL